MEEEKNQGQKVVPAIEQESEMSKRGGIAKGKEREMDNGEKNTEQPLWKKMFDLVNKNSGFVLSCLTGALVVVTGIYTCETALMTELSKKGLDFQCKTFEDQKQKEADEKKKILMELQDELERDLILTRSKLASIGSNTRNIQNFETVIWETHTGSLYFLDDQTRDLICDAYRLMRGYNALRDVRYFQKYVELPIRDLDEMDKIAFEDLSSKLKKLAEKLRDLVSNIK